MCVSIKFKKKLQVKFIRHNKYFLFILEISQSSIDNDVTGKVIPDMNTNKSKVTIHKFVISIC